MASRPDKTYYALKKGDVVLFLGNSITQGAAPLIAYLTADIKEKYPELLEGEDRVQFIIAGIGGEQAFEGLKRLPELLEQHKPTVCVVNYGTCEVTFENQQAYLPAMEKILSTLKAAGTAATIVSPPPCSPANWKSADWPASQFTAGLPAMAKQARKLAKRENLLFADAFKALSKHNKGDGAELTTDGIHLNAAGYRRLADALQETWGY